MNCKDGRKVKKELDDGEITIEYNDITCNRVHFLTPLKIESKVSNKTIQLDDKLLHKSSKLEANNKTIQPEDKLLLKTSKIEAYVLHNENIQLTKTATTACTSSDITTVITEKSTLKPFQINNKITVSSSNVTNLKENLTEPPKTSFTLPFNGARFLHTQVHSNSVLQSLLKDIITLNNEKDEVDEDAISQEIVRLRSKNNLPSFNAEIPREIPINLELEDSDYSEGSDYECSYYEPKRSENYGKDSGYDNESQYSESLEDDSKSEVQDNLRNETGKSLVIAEPEYIDLDNYYDNKKRKLTGIRSSLIDIRTIRRSSQHANESISSLNHNNGLTCPICNKTLKSKRAYRHHTKNGTGCVRKSPEEQRLFNCIGNCKFFGTKEEFFTHKRQKQEKRLTSNKSNRKDKTLLPVNCNICSVPFYSSVSLERHYKTHHKQKRACLFCDFVCDSLSEYNLHISSRHSKRVKKESSSSDSDSLHIIEIE